MTTNKQVASPSDQVFGCLGAVVLVFGGITLLAGVVNFALV